MKADLHAKWPRFRSSPVRYAKSDQNPASKAPAPGMEMSKLAGQLAVSFRGDEGPGCSAATHIHKASSESRPDRDEMRKSGNSYQHSIQYRPGSASRYRLRNRILAHNLPGQNCRARKHTWERCPLFRMTGIHV